MGSPNFDLDIHYYALGDLLPRAGNPNHMTDEQYRLLVSSIRKLGFLEPIVVEPLGDGKARIADGEHRARALAELGATRAPCVHGTAGAAEDIARAIRIAKNRIRGSLNLSEVASELSDLRNAGWSVEDLTATGFGVDEVNDLLQAMKPLEQDIVDGAGGVATIDAREEGEEPKAYSLEILFEDRKAMAKARRALRKAAGVGGTLADGLIALLEGSGP